MVLDFPEKLLENHAILKVAIAKKRAFPQDVCYLANTHMRKCSASLAIREIQINNFFKRFYLFMRDTQREAET